VKEAPRGYLVDFQRRRFKKYFGKGFAYPYLCLGHGKKFPSPKKFWFFGKDFF
jgi:hypothetical protein